MFKALNNKKSGFTLVELLVVIAIISLLSSVVLTSLNSARAKARDAKRKADLKELATALNLFYDKYGYYPRESADHSNGVVGEGAGIDTLLEPFISSVPHDPSGPGNSTYLYYYDGRQYCTGRDYPGDKVAVIFAKNLESSTGNGSQLCSSWGGEGGAGGTNTWHIILGPSDG